MKHKLLTSLIIIMTLMVTGCANLGNKDQDARPDWVDGSSSQYPRKQYIIGRGQAEKLEIAQDRARANIAKTFQVNVVERSSDIQQHKQTSDEHGTRTSLDTHIQRQINTQTDQIINGIEIADVWQHPKTNHYYTLAILSRQQAFTRLRQQIEQLDNATQKYISESRSSNNALNQAGFAAQALAAQQQRAHFQKMATVVDLSGRGIKARWKPAMLETDLNDILSRVRIQPLSTNQGDIKQTTISILAGALASAGMTPSDESNSDYILTGQLNITNLGKRDGWYWQRGTMNIKLTNKASGQLIGSHTWNKLKAAGLDNTIAEQRILKKIDDTLKKDMRQTLINMVMPQ